MFLKPDFTFPLELHLLGRDFSTFLVFGVIAFFLSLFVIWREGKKDGFDEERLFDVFLLTQLLAFMFSRFVYALTMNAKISQAFQHTFKFWEPGLDARAYILSLLFLIYLFVTILRWSLFRILDIFALSIALGLSLLSLSEVAFRQNFVYLIVFSLLLLFYSLGSHFRNVYVRSGTVFSLFMLFTVTLGYFLGYKNYLIFYTILITLSLGVFYLRERKSIVKTSLPKELLVKLKSLLSSKEQRLEKENKLLTEEDPYMSSGRTDDNADLHDDVYEDIGHKEVELKRSSLQKAQTQVRRALAKFNLGTYGYCEICGNPIEQKRLEAYPEATTCLNCSNKQSK